MDIANELIRLVEMRDESEIAAYLKDRISDIGFQCKLQRVYNNRKNLIVNYLNTPDVLLATHMDVVPLISETKVVGSRVYGVGSADAKASIVSLLYALSNIESLGECTISFLVDEEEQGRGSEKLLEICSPKFAIVCEPTDMRICIAGAGSFEVEFEVLGKAAHGGEVEKGKNAIIEALEIIHTFKNLEFMDSSHGLVGDAKFNIQFIEGGSSVYAVPDYCRFIADFRVLPNHDLDAMRREIEKKYYKRAKLNFLEISPAFETSTNSKVFKILNKAFKRVTKKENKISGIKSWTDANNLSQYGTEVVVFGPGKLEVCHTTREYVEIGDVEIAGEVLREFIYLWSS